MSNVTSKELEALHKAAIKSGTFLPDELESLRQRVAELERERDALQFAVPFAIGAIEDAIYLEDGLDGDVGQRVVHVLREAAEHGTFDRSEYGSLPRPHAEVTLDAVCVALGLDPDDEVDVVHAVRQSVAELARLRTETGNGNP